MITLHLTMLFISFISILTTLKSYAYLKLLTINLTLASEPSIKAKLDDTNPATHIAFNMALKEYHSWKTYWLPQTYMVLIYLIALWYSFTIDSPVEQFYIIFASLWAATIFTKIFTTNIFPTWLHNWTFLLQSVRDEVNLEYLEHRLTFIKSELEAVLNGKYLPPSELNKLKYEGLFLAKEAEHYKKK